MLQQRWSGGNALAATVKPHPPPGRVHPVWLAQGIRHLPPSLEKGSLSTPRVSDSPAPQPVDLTSPLRPSDRAAGQARALRAAGSPQGIAANVYYGPKL